MPKKRVSNSKSKARRSTNDDVSHWLSKSLKSYQFKGLHLSGGKSDKTTVATVEFYLEQDKIVLSHLYDSIKNQENLTSDEKVFDFLKENKTKIIGVNAPLKLPKCIRCRLKCPGVNECKEEEIIWLKESYQSINSDKKKKRIFTPYTERCAEFYINNFLEENFSMPHALGANIAPQAARIQFIRKRIKTKMVEVYPKMSLWRIGRSLKIQKSYLRFYKHTLDGQEARQFILEKLVSKDIVFLYEQDKKILIESNESFDAFICAITAVLNFKKLVEKPPENFPLKSGWVEVPLKDCFL